MRKPTLKERAILQAHLDVESKLIERGLTTKQESIERIMRGLMDRRIIKVMEKV